MKKTSLSFKEVAPQLEQYSLDISKKSRIELWEGEQNIIAVDEKPAFFYYGEKLIPLLTVLQHTPLLKKITVDPGAIKFIVNGADIMRPGIVHIEEGIIKGGAVMVIDATHHKPLAVGMALFSAEEMQAMKNGKVIKNIHYVGDAIWQRSKEGA